MRSHKEYLNNCFAHHANRDDSKFAVGGVILGGAVAAITSNLLVGSVVTALGYGLAFRQIYNDGKRIRLMGETGVVAPLLKGEERQRYLDTFGTEEADKQAIAAIRLGVQPYGEALDGLEERNPGIMEQLDKLTPIQPGAIYFSPTPVQPINASLDGSKLALSQLMPQPTDQPTPAPTNDPYGFLKKLSQSPLQPVIIAGQPGSGKGVLAAMALAIGVRENGLRFRVFNPKPKLAEAGYWSRAEVHYLKNRLEQDDDLFTDLMAVLEEFASEGTRRNDTPGEYQPYVLLLEEINAVTGLFTPKQKQLFKAKITALASLLRGCNMALWMSGQSITLEDLGLTGKSNRAMFTAIVAVGTVREAIAGLCQPLGIPFDNSKLKPDARYWLTANEHYEALPFPQNVPTYPDWASVPNLIDMRPGMNDTPNQVDVLLADVKEQENAAKPAIDIQDDPRTVAQKLEDSYKLNARDEFPFNTRTGLEDTHEDVLVYLDSKGGEAPKGMVKNWAKSRRKGALDSTRIDEILINLVNLHLIESFTPEGTKGEWVRLRAT